MNKNKNVFLSFVDENNEPKKGYYELISLGELITFKSDTNTFIIPNSRLIKIKFKNEDLVLEGNSLFYESYDKHTKLKNLRRN